MLDLYTYVALYDYLLISKLTKFDVNIGFKCVIYT